MKILFVNPPVVKKNNLPLEVSPTDGIKRLRFLDYLKKNIKSKLIHKAYNYLAFFPGDITFGVRAGSRWPWTARRVHGGPPYPFVMGYAASYLQSKGYEVNIIDAVVQETYLYSDFLKQVEKENASIVVIETSELTFEIDMYLAKKISRFTEVALAGSYLTPMAKTIMSYKDTKFISYYLKGEYIESSLKMVLTRDKGIYESEVIRDLDNYPTPFRDINSFERYYDPSMPTPRPQLQIWGSKGCPFRCSFCLWPQTMYGGCSTQRSPKSIADEIRKEIKEHNIKSIFFDDDTFNIGTERISQLCDELKEIGLPWTMMGRLDCSPDWLYDKMVDSGCVGMRFGVESFDKDVLKNVKKGLERVDFLQTLKYISDKYPKVMIHLTMMKGLPGQTKEIHQKDMEILRDIGYEEIRNFPHKTNIYRNYQLSELVVFSGTKMYDNKNVDDVNVEVRE